jgi:hypothetical protein
MPREEVHGPRRLRAFRYGRPHHGYYGLVELRAVFKSLGSRKRSMAGSAAAGLARRASFLYRAALLARSQAGQFDWVRCHDLGNCCPAFVAVRPKTKCCNQPHICPFCWARRAVAVWRRIDLALFPQREDGTRPGRCDYSLVLTSRTCGPAVMGKRPAVAIVDRTSDRKLGPSGALPGRGYEIRQLAPAGALDVLTIDIRGRVKAAWVASVRQLLVVDPGRELVIPGARIKRIESPTRKQVAKAVAWAWRYPRGLLLRKRKPAHPAAIAVYLAACKGRRMWATYGVFNEGKPWDKELHAAARKLAAEKRAAAKASLT